jgi:hypothetical protein
VPGTCLAQGGGKKLIPYSESYYANPPEGWTEKDIKRGGMLTVAFRGDPPTTIPR